MWGFFGSSMTLLVLSLINLRGAETSLPGPISPPRPAVERAVIATVPAPRAEKPIHHPAPEPGVWKVLFNSPKAGAVELSRRTDVKIFFNGPVKQDVAEWAFNISPSAPGTFSWPRPDLLVFAPTGALQPATRYTVSLTPMTGFRDGKEYELDETRWSFSTGSARTYEQDIRPLVSTYCRSCHAENGSAATTPLESYHDVRRFIIPGRSGESPFYTMIQKRQHHINMAGPNHSTNAKLALIKDWIDEDGAAP